MRKIRPERKQSGETEAHGAFRGEERSIRRTPADSMRMHALAEVLKHPTA